MLEHYRRTHGVDSQTSVESVGPGAADLRFSVGVTSCESSATTSAAPSSPHSDQDDSHMLALREVLQAQIKRLEPERAEADKKLTVFRAAMSDL